MEKLQFKLYSCRHGDENYIPCNIEWTLQGIYLCGDLQSKIDYDLTFIDRKNELKFFNQEIQEGMYLVDIVDSTTNTVYNNCILYLWYFPNNIAKEHWYRGLICLPTDKKGNKDAKNKYDKRTLFL